MEVVPRLHSNRSLRSYRSHIDNNPESVSVVSVVAVVVSPVSQTWSSSSCLALQDQEILQDQET